MVKNSDFDLCPEIYALKGLKKNILLNIYINTQFVPAKKNYRTRVKEHNYYNLETHHLGEKKNLEN